MPFTNRCSCCCIFGPNVVTKQPSYHSLSLAISLGRSITAYFGQNAPYTHRVTTAIIVYVLASVYMCLSACICAAYIKYSLFFFHFFCLLFILHITLVYSASAYLYSYVNVLVHAVVVIVAVVFFLYISFVFLLLSLCYSAASVCKIDRIDMKRTKKWFLSFDFRFILCALERTKLPKSELSKRPKTQEQGLSCS